MHRLPSLPRAVPILLALSAMALAPAVLAQGAPPGTPQAGQAILSDAARVLPAVAARGMVSAQEGQAARIGVEILKKGGNAVDAAVAVAFAEAVTLPRAGNLGGGGFMMVYLADKKKTIAINYRETAPAGASRDMFLDDKGEPDPKKSRDSGLAVGVPGTVRGLAQALAFYGSGKFTLADLIAPAQMLAEKGIAIEEDLADSLPKAARLTRQPAAAAIFTKNGRPFERGDMLVQRDLAATLAAIAKDGPDAFYKGPIARKIVATVKEAGGVMTEMDLADYKVVEREPVTGSYRGYDISSMPPPSSGGVHLIEILNVLEGFDLKALGAGSAETIHLMAEAMKPAYADRAAWLGDPDRVKVPARGLTSKRYAEGLRKAIDMGRARPADEVKAGDPLPHESDQTTHFSVVDKDGNAVANTYTLNFSYGAAIVADGTGVLLNNEMDDFSAKTGALNGYGLVGGDSNSVSPGARPLSSMTPTFLFKDGKLAMVVGSPGGSRIITTVLQTIVNVIDFDMNIAEAVTAPRVHHQWRPDSLLTEEGLSPDTLKLLRQKGHKVLAGSTSGSVNAIAVTAQGLMGAADPRQRGTLAAGY